MSAELGELGETPSKSLRESELYHPQHLNPVGGRLGELGVSWGGVVFWHTGASFPPTFHRA
jgi:hypothetical protein